MYLFSSHSHITNKISKFPIQQLGSNQHILAARSFFSILQQNQHHFLYLTAIFRGIMHSENEDVTIASASWAPFQDILQGISGVVISSSFSLIHIQQHPSRGILGSCSSEPPSSRGVISVIITHEDGFKRSDPQRLFLPHS